MYVIVDALGGSWIVPKVFFKYLEVVDEGIMPKVDSNVSRLVLAHIGNEFQLFISSQNDTYKIVFILLLLHSLQFHKSLMKRKPSHQTFLSLFQMKMKNNLLQFNK